MRTLRTRGGDESGRACPIISPTGRCFGGGLTTGGQYLEKPRPSRIATAGVSQSRTMRLVGSWTVAVQALEGAFALAVWRQRKSLESRAVGASRTLSLAHA